MLKLEVVTVEAFDDSKSEFVKNETVILELEHSLVSASKWESKYEKPFLSGVEMSTEETLDYIGMMNLGAEFPPELFSKFSDKNYNEINAYIAAKMTATWFSEEPKTPSTEIVTTEIIYYWMIALNIPFECQHWHLARLLTLIQVCNRKNAPAKKMSRAQSLAQRRQLNDQRRREMGSRG